MPRAGGAGHVQRPEVERGAIPIPGPPALRVAQTPGSRREMLLALQHKVGNAAVARLFAAQRLPGGPRIQRVNYGGENYDEDTMPLRKLQSLIGKIRDDRVLDNETRGGLLAQLEPTLVRREKSELVIVGPGGLPSASPGRRPGPTKWPTRAPPPVPGTPKKLASATEPARIEHGALPSPDPTTAEPKPKPKPPLSVPAVAAEAEAKLAPGLDAAMPAGARPPKLAPFDVEMLSSDNRASVEKELKSWEVYAIERGKELSKRLDDETEKKAGLRSGYYSSENVKFRTDFKKLRRQVEHLDSTERLVPAVLKKLSDNERDASFLLFKRGEWLAGVAYLQDSLIADIVGNPRDIAPEEGQRSQGGGVAKAVIGVSILSERKRASQGGQPVAPMRLFALTNKVKGVYAHYGFKVFTQDKRLLEHHPGRKVKDGDDLTPYKTEWHSVQNMVLTPEQFQEFLVKQKFDEVVNIPPELRQHLTSEAK